MERGGGEVEVENAAQHASREEAELPRSVLSSRQIIVDDGGWPWWIVAFCDTRDEEQGKGVWLTIF